MKYMVSAHGMASIKALKIVKLRPPNLAGPTV